MKLWILLLIAAIAGCQHATKRIDDPTSQLAAPVAAARSEVIAAKETLKAKDYPATDQHLDKTIVHLDAETKVIIHVADESVKTQQKLIDAENSIAKHRNDWFGPRAHRWFWGLLISGLLLSVGLGLLRGFLPASGILQFASHFVIGVFSFGAGWVHAAAKWLGSKLHKPTPAITA